MLLVGRGVATADTARKSAELCKGLPRLQHGVRKVMKLLLSVSETPAQLDIDSNHRPVYVNAIVPHTPTRLTVAFG